MMELSLEAQTMSALSEVVPPISSAVTVVQLEDSTSVRTFCPGWMKGLAASTDLSTTCTIISSG